MSKQKRDEQEDVKTRTEPKVQVPRKYKVLLHNDDYTTMEFVVWVLQGVFHHTPASATRIMLHIHRTGIGVAGVYARDVAETRVEQVLKLAKEAGHPLQCTMEPE
jgi:ATP-dependent Clp protease adaptor protein ClpS